MSKIQIKAQGIQKIIDKLDINEAVAEYIWNGLDANATKIDITIETLNEFGALASIKVADNGDGIERGKLTQKFEPFYESEKSKESNHSLPHGHNGYGRFSFILFANKAEWTTVYENKGKSYKYPISINKVGLENYYAAEEAVTTEPTGTVVEFSELAATHYTQETLERSLSLCIKKNLGWFLVLRPEVTITIDGVAITSDDIIGDTVITSDRTSFCLKHAESGIEFEVKYVQWRGNPYPEYSKFYYQKSDGSEAFKENTKLNNKGDKFYHSLFIKSTLFDDFTFVANSEGQADLKFSADRGAEEFKFLEDELVQFLRHRRRPYIQALSTKNVDEFVSIGAIEPVTAESTPIEKLQNEITKEIVDELYNVEPRIFNGLKKEQKLIFGRMLGLMVSNGNMRDDIINIIGGVVDMTDADIKELSDLINDLSLQGVTRLAKLVQGRYTVYEKLKKILYQDEKSSLEEDIQKVLQDELWLIDERYTLITAEEPDFEDALRAILEFRKGAPIDDKLKIDAPDRQKEMDVFACRKRKNDGIWEHIVIEIKRASKLINKADSDQLYRYQELIRNEKRFNSPDSIWKFYLIGNDYATDNYVQSLKKNLKNSGKADLMMEVDNFETYALTWSQLLERFEMDHDYLKEQLYAKSEEILHARNEDAEAETR